MKNCVVRRAERVRLTRQLSNGGSVVCGVVQGKMEGYAIVVITGGNNDTTGKGQIYGRNSRSI